MKYLNKSTIIIAISTLIVGVLLGWLFFGGNYSKHDHELVQETKSQIWTCAMHPGVRQNEPGNCPICGMELIPLQSDQSADNPMEIRMSPTAMKLASIQTAVVQSSIPEKEVRLNGKVQANEQNVYSQTSHIPGRIEQLKVNITGEYVKKGQAIAYVYSPDLVTAQKELFEAYKIRDTQISLYQASREKLKNWKLTEKQIDQIIEKGSTIEQFPILADVNGIVISKNVNLGDYLKQGSVLYQIADLSRLWILFDVYESDIPWVNVGDEVSYTVESLPGQSFSGKVNFIDPVINPKTRVAKARITANNSNLKLKPEMFASGVIISPVNQGSTSIIVPKTAVMWTGKRSVVYVKSNTDLGIAFMMREVTLGPSLGDSYIIEEGLEAGEEIATNGTFSIDAAAQLAGKPSMMSPSSGIRMAGHQHGLKNQDAVATPVVNVQHITLNPEAKNALYPVIEKYLKLKDALVNDNFDLAQKEGSELLIAMKAIEMNMFEGDAINIWMQHGIKARGNLKQIVIAKNIGLTRALFKPFSEHMIQLARIFNPFDKKLYIQHCPMADDFKGADWLSMEENIMNPYFGESMLTCGEVTDEISN